MFREEKDVWEKLSLQYTMIEYLILFVKYL